MYYCIQVCICVPLYVIGIIYVPIIIIYLLLFLCLGGGMGSIGDYRYLFFLGIGFLSVLGWGLTGLSFVLGVGWVYTLIGSLRIGDVRDPIVLFWVIYYEVIV